jgi:hypothetical protein
MRSLFPHVSSLNGDEYALFSCSFVDLVAPDTPLKSDGYSEKSTASTWETCPWLRGRYLDISVSELDEVRASISLLPLVSAFLKFSPSRARSCVYSPQVRSKTRPLIRVSSLKSFVFSYVFGAERNPVFKQSTWSFIFFMGARPWTDSSPDGFVSSLWGCSYPRRVLRSKHPCLH